MSVQSAIEWQTEPGIQVRGRTKVSPGCEHRPCGEIRRSDFAACPATRLEYGLEFAACSREVGRSFTLADAEDASCEILMSDLFHEGVPDDYIEAVARVMLQANWHTFQVLTKRSVRMRDLLRTKLKFAAKLKNVWWGVSVEDKQYGVPRIAHLRQSGASVKFLSVEPLIEDLGVIGLDGIDWMIVGGESGPGARPIDARWVRSLRRQCRGLGAKVFLQAVGRRSEAFVRTNARRAGL